MMDDEFDDFDDPDYFNALLDQLYEEEFGGPSVYSLLNDPGFLCGQQPWPQFVDV